VRAVRQVGSSRSASPRCISKRAEADGQEDISVRLD